MHNYSILTESGWKKFDGVNRKFRRVIEILHTFGTIRCTPEHIFIIDNKEVVASSLKPNDKISKTSKVVYVRLLQSEYVYDPVNVDGNHTYIHDKSIQSHNCTFLGSSMTLLSGSTLARLTHDIPIKEYTDAYKGLKVYAEPIESHSYSMTVDVSRGRHLDYSAFIVYDITKYPHTIAATYKNNEISPLLYATVIDVVGKTYNSAYLLIETNDIGGQVADVLWNELEYPEMFWTKSGDILGKQGADPYPGIRTTKKTKRIGCANLKSLIDNNQLIVNDYDFIHELSTFVQSKTGSYEADAGYNDDMVMCGVMYAWLVSQRWFNELTDQDIRTTMYKNQMKELEDQICMSGFYDDGVEDAAIADNRDNYHSWNGYN